MLAMWSIYVVEEHLRRVCTVIARKSCHHGVVRTTPELILTALLLLMSLVLYTDARCGTTRSDYLLLHSRLLNWLPEH
eukprot:12564-Heterococcus_DN1.PRE.1